MAQYPPYTASGVAPASGVVVLPFRARGSMSAEVSQVTSETSPRSGGVSAVCSLRLNGALISPLVPTGDAASGDPTVWVRPGDEMTVEWTGLVPGTVAKMAVIYDLKGQG